MSIFQCMQQAVEKLYADLCTIKNFSSETNKTTGITESTEKIIAENILCRLDYTRSPPTDQTEAAASITQTVRLFLSPEIKVKEGSAIEVKHNGSYFYYKSAGKPILYESHQEIELEASEEWA